MDRWKITHKVQSNIRNADTTAAFYAIRQMQEMDFVFKSVRVNFIKQLRDEVMQRAIATG